MHHLDDRIVLWLNQFAGRAGVLDGLVKSVSGNELMQAVVPVTLLWFFWFATGGVEERRRRRELVLATTLAVAVSVMFARGLALILPFRQRPYAAAGLGYRVIDAHWTADLHQWSSFPSDHAVLFFALATGITLIHRRIGALMLCYAALVDCLPRVYLGVHYPSDILGGALIGSAAVLLSAMPQVRRRIAAPILPWFELRPALAYAALFVFTFQIATMFDSAIQLAQMIHTVTSSMARNAAPLMQRLPAILAALDAWGSLFAACTYALHRLRSHSDRGTTLPGAEPGGFSADVPLDLESDPVPLSMMAGSDPPVRDEWLSPQLLDFTHDAIIIWEMDGAGILYWNRAAERLYGYSREEARGKVTHDLLRTSLTGGRGASELETALARYGVWVGELHHRTHDGRTIRVDARLALMRQQNDRWLVLEVNRDMTDQDEADAVRRQLTARLADLRGGIAQ